MVYQAGTPRGLDQLYDIRMIAPSIIVMYSGYARRSLTVAALMRDHRHPGGVMLRSRAFLSAAEEDEDVFEAGADAAERRVALRGGDLREK